MDEQQLLARHVAGDAGAFAELVARYRRPVAGYLARCGVPAPARDDLCQEIFLKIHNAAARYQPLRPLRVWIFTIVANTARSWFRKQQGDRQLLDPRAGEAAATAPGAVAIAEANETSHFVQSALDSLPLPQREVVLLSCIEGLDHDAIAETLAMPVNTVKTHLRRARLAIAKALARRRAQAAREVAR